MHKIFVFFLIFLMAACAPPSRYAHYPDYQQEPKLESSLFGSDTQILSNESVKNILESKIDLTQSSKLALIKYEGNDHQISASKYYGYYYWRSEEYLKLQQNFIDTVTSKILGSANVREVITLPSLLLPKNSTISTLREAAVRTQSDLLLIFRLTSDIYYDYAFWGDDEAKAFSTCEFVLFDIRTGIIPFTIVITKEVIEQEKPDDANRDELMKRAEKIASLKALSASTDKLIEFFNKFK